MLLCYGTTAVSIYSYDSIIKCKYYKTMFPKFEENVESVIMVILTFKISQSMYY